MLEEDKHFIKRYEELLDKGYCDCNEMNCIDNNSPRRILKIVKELDNINEKLSLALESAEKKLVQEEAIINKAIKWFEDADRRGLQDLLDILRGSDKE